MATLDGVSLGNIQSEDFSKVSGVEVIQSVQEDSNQNEAIELAAPVFEITVSSVYSGTISECKSFALQLESWINGQQSGLTYVSDLMNKAYNVAVRSGRWNWSAGRPNEVEFTLVLVEAGVVS